MNGLANTVLDPIALKAPNLWLAAAITLLFAAFGRLVRGVTTAGAIAGAVVCFALLIGAGWGGFAALCAVFVITWAATRFGYTRKQAMGTAEARSGRTGAQVLANLGVAAICAAFLATKPAWGLRLAVGAALCEAAADTVSSEIGQAIGGTPRLITTFQAVRSGTNGAVTLAGTLAGLCVAVAVGLVYGCFGEAHARTAMVCAAAGIVGTIADSLLGATIEAKGLAGNNTVNFFSTLIAAAIGIALT